MVPRGFEGVQKQTLMPKASVASRSGSTADRTRPARKSIRAGTLTDTLADDTVATHSRSRHERRLPLDQSIRLSLWHAKRQQQARPIQNVNI